MDNYSAKQFFELIKSEENLPVVAKFGAEWCPPCKEFEPTIKSLASDKSEFVTIAVDIDDEYDLAVHMGVASAPTTFLIYKGLCLDSVEGVMTEDQVRTWVKNGVSKAIVKSLEVPND